MIPIAVCFLLANSTVFCPPTDITQTQVQQLFDQLTDIGEEVNLFSSQSRTPTNDNNEDNNDESRDNRNEEENDSDSGDELPSCQDDNRPRPGSCRDDLDTDEEPIEETNDDEEEKEEGE